MLQILQINASFLLILITEVLEIQLRIKISDDVSMALCRHFQIHVVLNSKSSLF